MRLKPPLSLSHNEIVPDILKILGEAAEKKYKNSEFTHQTIVRIEEDVKQLSENQINTIAENLTAIFLELT